MSTVGTLVIDWMTTGAAEPILTEPLAPAVTRVQATLTVFVFLLLIISKSIDSLLTGEL